MSSRALHRVALLWTDVSENVLSQSSEAPRLTGLHTATKPPHRGTLLQFEEHCNSGARWQCAGLSTREPLRMETARSPKHRIEVALHDAESQNNKQTPWPLVRERTIPTDRPRKIPEGIYIWRHCESITEDSALRISNDLTLFRQSAHILLWGRQPRALAALYSQETYFFLSLVLTSVRGCVKPRD
jgi:hypothetical protein